MTFEHVIGAGQTAARIADPKYAPCPLLRQYVATGRLGRKCGPGSYEY